MQEYVRATGFLHRLVGGLLWPERATILNVLEGLDHHHLVFSLFQTLSKKRKTIFGHYQSSPEKEMESLGSPPLYLATLCFRHCRQRNAAVLLGCAFQDGGTRKIAKTLETEDEELALQETSRGEKNLESIYDDGRLGPREWVQVLVAKKMV